MLQILYSHPPSFNFVLQQENQLHDNTSNVVLKKEITEETYLLTNSRKAGKNRTRIYGTMLVYQRNLRHFDIIQNMLNCSKADFYSAKLSLETKRHLFSFLFTFFSNIRRQKLDNFSCQRKCFMFRKDCFCNMFQIIFTDSDRSFYDV